MAFLMKKLSFDNLIKIKFSLYAFINLVSSVLIEKTG